MTSDAEIRMLANLLDMSAEKTREFIHHTRVVDMTGNQRSLFHATGSELIQADRLKREMENAREKMTSLKGRYPLDILEDKVVWHQVVAERQIARIRYQEFREDLVRKYASDNG